ncbi:MAG: enoyl-CoA hydratase/isomerase family protein [Proteobacteria bacterium]|nr:enoyl-CoA hydratase/isomerase family protein [Pseudomonadota bacterium]
MSALAADEVRFARKGAIGHILLNRPKALNALTLGMCELMTTQLKAWAQDDAVKAIVIRGAGEKAFCAGGDVVRLYEDGKAGLPYPSQFWSTEYRLNTLIKRYPKPYIALVDGIVMGGGVGVSVHGGFRVATEKTMFAMPETGIGLFPDVGGGYFLPRLTGSAGMYLGLSGKRLKGADCVALGLAEALVPHDRLDELETKLASDAVGDLDEISYLIAQFAEPVKSAPISTDRTAISRHFDLGSVEAIIASLENEGGEWGAEQAKILRTKSPTAMKVTFRQIREGANLSFEDCMKMEWRIANRCAVGKDFYEGVRALLIDKDNTPLWSPETLAAVTEADVAAYFAPLPGKELDLSNIL